MSIASRMNHGGQAAPRPHHPNELDLHRIARALGQRQRYRYVSPHVVPQPDGYRVRSACCSRTIDPSGGEIDVALMQWDADAGEWRLLARDHALQCWIEDSRFARLADLLARLNADPERRFWQ